MKVTPENLAEFKRFNINDKVIIHYHDNEPFNDLYGVIVKFAFNGIDELLIGVNVLVDFGMDFRWFNTKNRTFDINIV